MSATYIRTVGDRRAPSPPVVFAQIVAGVDGSEAGFEAARQAARLVAPEGRLELLSAIHLAEAALAGWSAGRIAEELEREAETALRRAMEIAGPRAEPRLVDGSPAPALMRELRTREATLVVVGSHGRSRLAESRSAASRASCSTTPRARC